MIMIIRIYYLLVLCIKLTNKKISLLYIPSPFFNKFATSSGFNTISSVKLST